MTTTVEVKEKREMMKIFKATCSLTGKRTTIAATSREAAATEIFDTLGSSYLNQRANAWKRFTLKEVI
tara:strand:+ start:470 stop:673 length:204 start_codon:yes stop_codon:yes gene_type:complete